MTEEKIKDIHNGLECISGYRPCSSCAYNEMLEAREDACGCHQLIAEDVLVLLDEKTKRIEELEEALLDMVNQFCQMGKKGELCHAFMSAEENAFDVLDIKYGEKASNVWKRFCKKWGR